MKISKKRNLKRELSIDGSTKIYIDDAWLYTQEYNDHIRIDENEEIIMLVKNGYRIICVMASEDMMDEPKILVSENDFVTYIELEGTGVLKFAYLLSIKHLKLT